MLAPFDDRFRWLPLSLNPAVWTYGKPQDRFFDFRMVVLRLTDGTLLVYSPLPEVDEACWQELASFGRVSSILLF